MAPPCEDCERVGSLEKRFDRLEKSFGHGGDKIAGTNGEGLYGVVEEVLIKVDRLLEEQQRKREAPGRVVKGALLVLPLIGAASAALNWFLSHVRLIP